MVKEMKLLERQEIAVLGINEDEPVSWENESTIFPLEKESDCILLELPIKPVRGLEQRKIVESPLLTAFKHAGIKPFTPESVAKYQKKMAKEFRIITSKKSREDFVLFGFVAGIVAAAFCFKAVYLISLIALIIMGVSGNLLERCMRSKKDKNKSVRKFARIVDGSINWFILILSIPSGTILPFLIFIFTGPATKKWEEVPFDSYKDYVPEFASDTAREIKMRCPDAELFVEHLTRHPDPFLVAVFKKKRYHLEVWSEPKYKEKRQV